MKIVNVIKSTSSNGNVKYFNDFMQASFHIQSGVNDAFQYKLEPGLVFLEPCLVFFDGESYCALTKVSNECEPDIASLPPNKKYKATLVYLETLDGGGSGSESSESCSRITTNPKENYNEYDMDPLFICKDENGIVYEMGTTIQIEKCDKEYEAIKPTVNEAISKASDRKTLEHQQAMTLLVRNKQDLFAAQQKLTTKQQKLTTKQQALEKEQQALEKKTAELNWGMRNNK